MAVYQFVCHDRVRDCDMWRYRSPVSLWVEWLTAWLERDREARVGYRAWLLEGSGVWSESFAEA